MGAGWNADEHRQLGIPFPSLGERYGMLEEAVEIVHGLWTQPDGWSFVGAYWQVEGARFAPRPERAGRRHPRLLLGGYGGPRLARLVARFGDEFNLVSASPAKARAAYARIDSACEAAGRDPAQVARSAMTGVLIAESEADLRDRIRAQMAMTGGADADADAWLAERRARWIMGTLDEARERVAEMEAAGVQRLMLQDFLPRDLEMIGLMSRLAT
jgi:alkanesulfonate monooxygenase SsuD/methylene tetrahydromethanopterin reductase-like flavin-dependent oxidoreductase (luciferase family)